MAAVRNKPQPNAACLAPKIIDWFLANARDMPWRRTLDPYGIWVSEIMLQQTQVKTVIPYWIRWMKCLPTIGRLARAEEATILKLWEGLGYYTRVRNLQKAAGQIVGEHGGEFPAEPAAIIGLSGIGRYTAGAIASIAFDRPEPILDGNVIRLLTRVFGISGDPKDKTVNGRLWDLAGEIVSGTKSGVAIRRTDPMVFAGECSVLNQGLMEMGATVCLPANPACPGCPLRTRCVARAEDRIAELPNSAKRVRATKREFATVVLQRGRRFFVRQRKAGSVNAGFWEFPNLEITKEPKPVREVCRTLLGHALEGEQIDRFGHSITRYRFQQTVYLVALKPNLRISCDGEWVTAAELRKRPFYSPQIRVFDRL
jgi:A/G-specific adenine glycosylase